MDVTKKKKLRNKLIAGMGVGFILTVLWIIFMMIRFFLGKIMKIFTGMHDMTDEAMDLGMNKLMERNDEIGEMARSVQETFSSIGNVVVGIRKASAELGEVTTENLVRMPSKKK